MNLIDKTDNKPEYSEIIVYCPSCGADNHLPCCYASNNTTGVIYCRRCGEKLQTK